MLCRQLIEFTTFRDNRWGWGKIIEMLNFRILFLLLGITSAAPAIAACFDNPTWHDDAITRSFLKGLDDDPAGNLRRASLNMLLDSADAAEEQRNEIRHRLMRIALLQHEGDRGAFRRELRAGTLYDVVRAIDLDGMYPTQQWEFIAAYWLSGCPEEALNFLTSLDFWPVNQLFMPIATGDTVLLRELAGGQDHGSYLQRRLLTFAALLGNPGTKDKTLQDLLDDVLLAADNEGFKREEAIDFIGLNVALDLVRGQKPEQDLLSLLQRPDASDPVVYEIQLGALVAWASAAGFCEETSSSARALLAKPAEHMFFHRILLEASVMRCLTIENQ